MLSSFTKIWLGLAVGTLTFGQNTATPDFTAAYQDLAHKDYNSAIAHFQAGLKRQPGSPNIHKDLAYTLLKVGDNIAARDEFETALRLNQQDEQASLEYAFLAYETGKPVEARRIFDRLRKSTSPTTRKTAEQAFQNIDAPLAEGIARWREVLLRSESPTAHCELVHLAELREDKSLAAEQSGLCHPATPHISAVQPPAPSASSQTEWSKLLDSVGLTLPSTGITILQGNGPAVERFGIDEEPEAVPVRQISDAHNPRIPISWSASEIIHRTHLPADFKVFAWEKCSNAPVLAGRHDSGGIVLWIATSPGERGFQRYPYLIQALMDLGIPAPSRAANIWAFFDSAYRIRADVDYLAQRWRDAGISTLYVAAWHNMEPDGDRDHYLTKLIDACHRHAILVYAWLELPYMGERFWADHPQWREKTALGQDAQIGWRKLINLQNPECSRAAASQIGNLVDRFDWDGINLAELAFESQPPEGFTPLNNDVRSEFKEIADVDPLFLFDSTAVRSKEKDLQTFLAFRSVLASRLQSEWLKNLENSQKTKPYLDLVLTVRDINSDLLIRNPAGDKLGLDLRVVARDGSTYPTPKTTGVELLQSIHAASRSFRNVAVYAENTIETADLPLIGAAAARVQVIRQEPGKMELELKEQSRIEWPTSDPVTMDGQPWPIRYGRFVITTAGHHTIASQSDSPQSGGSPFTITDFNGDIQSATVSKTELDIAYLSRTRALVTFDQNVAALEVDGAPFWKATEIKPSNWAMLPAGQHLVTFIRR